MSGNTAVMQALSALRAQQGQGQSGVAPVGKQPDAKTIAFQAQMRMAQQAMDSSLFGDEERPASASGMEMSMLNDMLLMDALNTIARLTGDTLPGKAQGAPPSPEQALTRNAETQAGQGLGAIAAKFESGEKGAAAIGFDKTGGTSYGKFQMSSRAGTVQRFLNFLSEREPGWAQRLRAAGPANTGSVQGRMPAEWAKIAAESPERFEKLQTEFIKKDHYQPAREKILEQTGVDIEAARPALREALFSTAVQHGPTGAARIFGEVIDKYLGKPAAVQAGGKTLEQAVVSGVYDKRQGQFGGSTAAVRASVRGRLNQEKQMVLAMLDRKGMNKVV